MVYGQKTAGQKIPNSANGSQGLQTPQNHGNLIQNGQNKGRNLIPRARKPLYTAFLTFISCCGQNFKIWPKFGAQILKNN